MEQASIITERLLPILIVDDSTSYRLLLMRHLKGWGAYEIIQAEDGIQALEIIKSRRVGMVISDWEMPNMNGLELCKAIRDLSTNYVYFILVTSRGTSEDLILGMEAGADDFLAKPINQQELKVRLRAGERILRLEAHLEEKNQRLNATYQMMANDLKAAAQMQQSLLPQAQLNIYNVNFDWFFKPSLFVSGDMLNYFRLDHENIGFYSVDVSGHGVKSAMLSVTLSSLLNHNHANSLVKKQILDFPYYRISSPKEVVTALNSQFQMTADNMIYFTIVYGVLNLFTGQGVLTRAGHTSPIVIHADEVVEIIESDGGVPVGFLEEPDYQDVTFNLKNDSRLYLYTDGITECEGIEGQYGEARLIELLQKYQHMPLKDGLMELQHDLNKWMKTKQEDFTDDVSMLAVHFCNIVI